MIFVDYPGHLVATLLLGTLAALLIVLFRSRRIAKAGLWKWLLAALQYGAIVVIVIILWNPSRVQTVMSETRNSVLVFFDTSESMSVVEGGESRLEKAVAAFQKRFVAPAGEGPEYKLFGFDRNCYYAGNVRSLRRWGEKTNMHAVMTALGKQSFLSDSDEPSEKDAGGKVAGALLFTDGQADDKNANAYLPITDADVPIFVVAVGSDLAGRDVAVTSIEAPPRVAADTDYRVRVAVSAANLKGESVLVELCRDDEVIASKTLPPTAFSSAATTEFDVTAETLGTYTISARASIPAEELNTANNRRDTLVQVVESSRLKVLFYTQVANLNVGKIRQALARDENVELSFGLDAIINPALSTKAFESCGHVKLPAERAGFYEYDLIILGPCMVDSLKDTQIDALYSFVVDRGGGLILLPGKEQFSCASWKKEKIDLLMPVFFGRTEPVQGADLEGDLALTYEGTDSGIIVPETLTEVDVTSRPFYTDIKKKPAAANLATVDEEPVISLHRVGRGHVCLLNVARLYTWYREDLEGGLLRVVLSGLVARMAAVPKAEAAVELFAERQPNSTVRFDAYITGADFAAASDATVLLDVTGEYIKMEPVAQGRYVAEVEVRTDSIVATVQAEQGGVFLGQKTIVVNLPPITGEMDNVQPDKIFLQSLAQRLNAKYCELENLPDDIAGNFKAASLASAANDITSVWPRWLLTLCLLLTCAWYIRRQIGLV
jgi:hypothetical protein